MKNKRSGSTFRKLAAKALVLLFAAGALNSSWALADSTAVLSLDKQTIDLCPGDTVTLTAGFTPSDASVPVKWSTSNADIAAVQDGTVTAKAVGAADIVAATEDGTLSATCKVTVKSGEITSSVYKVDRASGLLTGVQKFSPTSLLLSNIGNTASDVSVLDQKGAPYTGNAVGTGMLVTLSVNGKQRDSLKAVVNGDTNGDGAVTISDYTLARLDILGLKKLTGEYLRAADANGDGQVSIIDYTLMRLDMLGLKPLGSTSTVIDLSGVSNPQIKALLEFALTLQGKPYVWGDEGPDQFDCSGFVYFCLNHIGYKIGRVSADTYSKNTSWQYIDKNSLQAGDLLFFFSTDHPGTIGHIGIYIGNNCMVNASSSYGCVVVCPLTGWYKDNLSHARRVFN